MEYVSHTSKWWYFQTIFGSLVEVSRSRHPEFISAINRAREKASED